MQAKDTMIANKFVRLIEDNQQIIVEQFMNDVLKNPKTVAYRNFDQSDLYEIGSRVCRELSKWLTKDLPKEDVKNFYRKIGKMRLEEGIPQSHVFQALVLLKRHMWLFVRRQIDNDIHDYKQAMMLSDRVVLFFDRAAYYMMVGYEEEMDRRKYF